MIKSSLLGSSLKGSVTSSPFDGKIQLITTQINSIDVNLRAPASKPKDIDKLEERTKRVESKLKDFDELHRKRVTLLNDTLARFVRSIEEERYSAESDYEEQVKRVTTLESRINEMISTLEKVAELSQAKGRERPDSPEDSQRKAERSLGWPARRDERKTQAPGRPGSPADSTVG